jgi:MFS family permease
MADVDPAELREAPSAATALSVPRPRSFSTFDAMEIPTFRWFLLSTVLGVLGFQIQYVALGWFVYLLTGSALFLGLITSVQAVCQTCISPIGGVIADRVERRTYIMLVRTITVGVAIFVAVVVVTHQVTYAELVIAAGILGVGFGLNGPARQALLAQLVGGDLLINAVSLTSGGMNLMRIVGPAVGGFLIGVIGVGGIFVMLIFLYAGVILALVPIPPQPYTRESKAKNALGDLVVGMSYTYRQPQVFGLLLLGTVPLFFAMPYSALLPIFAEGIWHAGPEGFGFLAAAPGVGGLVGALVVASLSYYRYKGRLMLLCAALYGVFLAAFALSPSLWLAAFWLFLVGIVSVAYGALVSSLVQVIIPNEMRGRVMSFYQMSFGVSGLSALPASAVAVAIGAPVTIAICGGLVVVSAVAIYRLRPVLAAL